MDEQPQVQTEIKKYIELFTDETLPMPSFAFDLNSDIPTLEEDEKVCAIQFTQIATHRVTVENINFVKDVTKELSGKYFPDARIYTMDQIKEKFGENSKDYQHWKQFKKQPDDVVVQTRTGKLWHFFKNDAVVQKDESGNWMQTYPVPSEQLRNLMLPI